MEGAQGAWLGPGRPLEGKVALLSLILDRRCRATRTVETRKTRACGRGAVGVLAVGANKDTNTEQLLNRKWYPDSGIQICIQGVEHRF